jgi:arylsulfatase A-like enzyme
MSIVHSSHQIAPPLKTVLFFFFLSLSALSIAQNNKNQNILFIAVDDLKPTLNCFGDSMAITPNIDALAAKGMIFTNNQCQQAVCAPSRASLLTGQYPDQTKVWDLHTQIRDMNPDIVTLPQYFKQNGYKTIGLGKVFDPRSVDKKMDEPSWTKYAYEYQSHWYSPTFGKPSYFYASQSAKDTIALLEAEAVKLGVNKREYVKKHYWPAVENADVPYDAYGDGAIANVGISLIEDCANSKTPFFLAIGFHRPHLPFNAPKEFWDLYNRDDFDVAEFRKKATNSPLIAYHNYDELRSYTDIPASGDITDSKQLELIHAYYATTSYIDFLIGKLLTKLNELNLDQNTIIVLWGDHGWHLGDHNLWCKHSNFEQATRSPLIISYPGQPNAGKEYVHPTEFTDIATTLCVLTEIGVPLDFEGESLIPAFEDTTLQLREAALSQYPRKNYMGYSLRTDRYRYTRWVNKTSFAYYASELYDYQTDPLETVNQAQNPDYADIKNRLDSIIQLRIVTPSTQEKVNFKVQWITENDTVAIDNASILFANETRKTNNNGELLITHIPGVYSFSVNAKGYHEVKGEIVVEKDTTVNISLEKATYNATFKVKKEWNNQPIENALVQFANLTEKTDNLGNAYFSGVTFDNYNVMVQLENGWKEVFSNIEISSDTTVVLNIAEPTYNIQVNVVNKYTFKGINKSTVSIAQLTKTTNSSGTVNFSVPEGKYRLTAEHEKYFTLEDSVSISSDTLFVRELSPAFSTLKFKIKENNTPVNKATITINTEEQFTNNLGIAYFNNYPTYTSYNYKVEKESYKTLEGSLDLINDTTINIQMKKESTSVDDPELKGFSFGPNPFTNTIYFRNQTSKYIYGLIHNLNGKLMNQFQLKNNNTFALNSTKFTPGIYSLTVVSGNKKVIYKIIKN